MNLKMIGSIAIVAGTAIGAGMLALPLATAALGIVPAFILLFVIWGISVYTSLLMLEVNLHSGINDNLHAITGKSLGKVGQLVQAASFLSLLFALTAAYLTGGSSLIVLKAQTLLGFDLDTSTAILLFTLVFGGVAGFGVAVVDKVSKVLFSLMVILLVLVVAFLMPEVSVSNMTLSAPADPMLSLTLAAIPVIFTSFGFHVCIATLVRYLDGDVVSLRKVLVIGSTIPLFCYILWLLVTLGTIGNEETNMLQGSLPALVIALQNIANQPWIEQVISLFADLALVTSFIGVTMSLFDFIAELTHIGNTPKGRFLTWLLTFIPPVICALYIPEGFVAVLGFAAIPLVLIVIFIPIATAIIQRKEKNRGYTVSGGTPALGLLGLAGAMIIVSQLAISL